MIGSFGASNHDTPSQKNFASEQEEADFRGLSLQEWRSSNGYKTRLNQYSQPEDDEADENVPLANLTSNRDLGSGHKDHHAKGSNVPPFALTVKASSGGVRWCRKCNARKPDRCHHCSSCGKCVLLMGKLPFFGFPCHLVIALNICGELQITIAYGSQAVWDTATEKLSYCSCGTGHCMRPIAALRRPRHASTCLRLLCQAAM